MRVIPRWLRRVDRGPSNSMTMVEHLEELRRRVFIALIAIIVGAIIGWFLYNPILNLILGPYTDACRKLPLRSRPPGVGSCTHVFVQGVVSIDGKQVGNGKPGPMTDRLREIYVEFAKATAT